MYRNHIWSPTDNGSYTSDSHIVVEIQFWNLIVSDFIDNIFQIYRVSIKARILMTVYNIPCFDIFNMRIPLTKREKEKRAFFFLKNVGNSHREISREKRDCWFFLITK